MDKMWYIHSMKYLTIKINEVLLHDTTWMNSENMLWKNPVTKEHIVYIPFIWCVQNRKILRDRKYINICLGLGWVVGVKLRVATNGYGVMRCSKTDCGDNCTTF